MSASLMPMPKQAFFATVNGAHGPIVGGKVYTYEAGTLTPKNTYTTAAGDVANANPVILDSRGEASVWLGFGPYDIALKDSADATIWTQKNVDGGSSQVGFLQAGTGAVSRTAQAKMRDIVSRDDFDTLANMWASSSFKPKIDPNTGKVWFNTDTSPLDYSTTKAGAVWQWKDAQDGAANELIPGAVFQFTSTGNGVVNSGTELSQTIWQGQFNFMRKAGDGSAHAFTSIGELEAFGPGGYNELGLFQGEATNKGSALGTMSGVEMLLKDSPDGGTTTYSTKMQAVVGRIAKYNPTTRKSYNFYASSEGKEPPNGVLGVNPNGYKKWQRGFDFEGADFTSGQFGLAPNNTYLAWLTAAGAAKPIIGISTSNNTVIAAADTTNKIQITNSALASRLEVDNANGDAVLIWVGGTLKRVGQGAADSAGTGHRLLVVVN